MDCRGLAKVWDANEDIRSRTRETGELLTLPPGSKWLEPTRPNAVAHADVLLPALNVLRDSKPVKLPYLTCLQAELRIFYDNVTGAHDEKVIYRNSQELKRLLGLIKRKAVKAKLHPPELTKDPNAQHVLGFLL